MAKREDTSGFNTRYSDLRFAGHHGDGSANQYPVDGYLTLSIADPAGTYDSSDLVPAGATIYEVRIEVTQIFNNVPTLIVGRVGNTNCLVLLTDVVDLTSLGTTVIDRELYTWVAPAAIVRATIGGAPDQGAGTITVCYTT